MARNLYSEAEEAYVREQAGLKSWGAIAEDLGRTERGVAIWASRRGIEGSYTHSRERTLLGLEARTCEGLFCSKEFLPVRHSHVFCAEKCAMSVYRLKKYNLTPSGWWSLFAAQGYACICGETDPDLTWHVDHDHRCCVSGSCGA